MMRRRNPLARRITLGIGIGWIFFLTADAAEFISKPTTPGSFPALPACRLTYSFGWSDLVEAAEATMVFQPTDQDFRVTVVGGTTGAARLIWPMIARHDAIIDPLTLRGRWMEQFETYRSKTIESRVEFLGLDGVRRFRRVNPDPELKAKWKHIRIPEPFDILGGILFVRSQPLADGDNLTLITFPGDSAYQIQLNVLRRESIPVMGVERRAICIQVELQKIEFKKNRPIGLMPHQRFRSGSVWISDDDLRIPLRTEVRIFVGAVTAELVDAKFHPQ